ncbi:MAG TPA: hypothetical protein VMG10_36625 [Gemmataceae bacterium]|nr:hypothetical protein [Gemmataceae bacterium]
MRPHLKWLLTVVFAGLIVSPALGQLPRLASLKFILENGVDKPILLVNAGVKKEIKLTDKQDKQVRKIVQEVFEKYQPKLREAKGDPEKQGKLMVEFTKETRDRVNEELPKILSAEQRKRLDQIQIQVNGIGSFRRPDVQQKLNLTIKQGLEIAKIGNGLQQNIAAVLKDALRMPLRKMEAALHKIKEMKEAATRKAVETLTKAQQKTWQEMNGEKFDFRLQIPRGVQP